MCQLLQDMAFSTKLYLFFLQCEVLLEVEKIFRNLCHIDLDFREIYEEFRENFKKISFFYCREIFTKF